MVRADSNEEVREDLKEVHLSGEEVRHKEEEDEEDEEDEKVVHVAEGVMGKEGSPRSFGTTAH